MSCNGAIARGNPRAKDGESLKAVSADWVEFEDGGILPEGLDASFDQDKKVNAKDGTGLTMQV